MTANQLLSSINLTYFHKCEANAKAHPNYQAYAKYILDSVMTEQSTVVEVAYAVGFIYRHLCGCGMYRQDDLDQLKKMIKSLGYPV